MLSIRADQMQKLRDASRNSFERRAADHLTQSLREECERIIASGSGLTLDGVVREGIQTAMSHGLRSEADVTRFLEMLVLTWPDLETHPAASWAKHILADSDISASTKMEIIHQQLLAEEPSFVPAHAHKPTVTMSGGAVGEVVRKCQPPKKASIIVRVFRADSGQAIANAKVELSGPTSGERHTSAGAGTTGFPVVEPGNYSVFVTVPDESGYEFVVPSVPGFRVEPAEQKVIVVRVACVTWISFVLVDEEGEPVAGERYSVRLPDGTFQDGTLDVSGRIRFDRILSGKCLISFPNLDLEAWEAI